MEPITVTATWLGVIALFLIIVIKVMEFWVKRNDAHKKAQDDKDKRIAAIVNGDDVTRIADELRDS